MRMFFARIQGFIKYKDLMGQLVLRDLKLKYRRSILGYLWQSSFHRCFEVQRFQTILYI